MNYIGKLRESLKKNHEGLMDVYRWKDNKVVLTSPLIQIRVINIFYELMLPDQFILAESLEYADRPVAIIVRL